MSSLRDVASSYLILATISSKIIPRSFHAFIRNRIASSVSAPIAESRLLLAAVPLQPTFAFKAAATEPKQAHTFFWTDKAQMKQQVDNPGSYVTLRLQLQRIHQCTEYEVGYMLCSTKWLRTRRANAKKPSCPIGAPPKVKRQPETSRILSTAG